MARRKQPRPVHQMSIAQFEAMFPDEEHCRAYLVARRWPDGVQCPRCGVGSPIQVATMPWHWQCKECAPSTTYRFSHIAGTIFENTNKPLRDWFRVAHMMLTSKKGISALQIMRTMGFGSYKTAWYMCHRIRAALVENNMDKLGGIVEVDETYIGGKTGNKHGDRGTRGRGTAGKQIVVGAAQREGNVVARVVKNTDARTLQGFVREAVSTKVTLLASDEHTSYVGLGLDFPHKAVRHGQREYVIGAVHTQTIDGFWSLIKRGIMGSFHKVSAKYLPLYVAEFQFRYNNRKNPDIFDAAIRGC